MKGGMLKPKDMAKLFTYDLMSTVHSRKYVWPAAALEATIYLLRAALPLTLPVPYQKNSCLESRWRRVCILSDLHSSLARVQLTNSQRSVLGLRHHWEWGAKIVSSKLSTARAFPFGSDSHLGTLH